MKLYDFAILTSLSWAHAMLGGPSRRQHYQPAVASHGSMDSNFHEGAKRSFLHTRRVAHSTKEFSKDAEIAALKARVKSLEQHRTNDEETEAETPNEEHAADASTDASDMWAYEKENDDGTVLHGTNPLDEQHAMINTNVTIDEEDNGQDEEAEDSKDDGEAHDEKDEAVAEAKYDREGNDGTAEVADREGQDETSEEEQTDAEEKEEEQTDVGQEDDAAVATDMWKNEREHDDGTVLTGSNPLKDEEEDVTEEDNGEDDAPVHPAASNETNEIGEKVSDDGTVLYGKNPLEDEADETTVEKENAPAHQKLLKDLVAHATDKSTAETANDEDGTAEIANEEQSEDEKDPNMQKQSADESDEEAEDEKGPLTQKAARKANSTDDLAYENEQQNGASTSKTATNFALQGSDGWGETNDDVDEGQLDEHETAQVASNSTQNANILFGTNPLEHHATEEEEDQEQDVHQHEPPADVEEENEGPVLPGTNPMDEDVRQHESPADVEDENEGQVLVGTDPMADPADQDSDEVDSHPATNVKALAAANSTEDMARLPKAAAQHEPEAQPPSPPHSGAATRSSAPVQQKVEQMPSTQKPQMQETLPLTDQNQPVPAHREPSVPQVEQTPQRPPHVEAPQRPRVRSSTPQSQQPQTVSAPATEQSLNHRSRAAASAAEAKDAHVKAVAAAAKAEAAARVAQAAARKASANAQAAAATTAIAQAQPTPQAAVLPDGWSSAKDTATGNTYYFNKHTGETQWQRPASPVVGKPQAAALPATDPAIDPAPPVAEQGMADGTEEGLNIDTDVTALPHVEDSHASTSVSDASRTEDASRKEVDDALADVASEEKDLQKEEQAIGEVSDLSSP